MNADLDYLYAHHAVGLCPEERCVAAREGLAALVEGLPLLTKALAIGFVSFDGDPWFAKQAGYDFDEAETTLLEVRDWIATVASREGSGT